MHVYVLTNNSNGKRYVGQTIREMQQRLVEHKRASCDTRIAKAIRKHGWDSFSVKSCELDDIRELNELEEFLVCELGSHVSEHGYNAKRGGANHGGQPITDETREKIRAALTGRHVSEETKKKISESNKRWTKTPEQIAKQAAALRGRKMPKHQRDKISKALMGRVVTPETRAKISAANKGKKRSPEIIELYRQRMLGKKLSEETKAKMRAASTGKKFPNRKGWTAEQKAANRERIAHIVAERKGL